MNMIVLSVLHVSLSLFSMYDGVVHGRVVTVIDLESLAPHRCGLDSGQGIWILSCVEAIQLDYRTSGAHSHVK